MSTPTAVDPADIPTSRFQPLRWWPAALLLLAMVLARTVPPLLENAPSMIWMVTAFGPLLCGALILLWWLLASRATWQERLLGLLGIVSAIGGTIATVHPSMRGPAIMVVTVPMGMATFAIGALLLNRHKTRTLVAVLLAACGFGFSSFLRSDGFWGDNSIGLHWRSTPSAEELLLAEEKSPSGSASVDFGSDVEESLLNPDWPGFRGPDRSARVGGIRLATNWETQPPEELWKVPVGPGWSSYAVAGDLLFAMEQRGLNELTACYSADTGETIWTSATEARFEDPLGGPGPRATPALAGGRLYALGASGHLKCHDARTGDVLWEQDLRKVADRDPPMWGYCSSPLVVDSVVIVIAGGKDGKGTLAFDAESGELRWSAASGEHSYSSPEVVSVAGSEYLATLSEAGMELVETATGSVVLNYEWKHEGYRAVQPKVVGEDSLLLPTGMGTGTRRLKIHSAEGELSVEEIWTSLDLKPDFNDFVVHDGFAYGFDNAIFVCIDLSTGKRKWKRGRYGKGQVLLLDDANQLLVVSERGKVLLLEASPEGHSELAEFQAIEGKTWNHPVLIGDRLYLRNSEEAACFRVALVDELPGMAPSETDADADSDESTADASEQSEAADVE